MTVTTCSRTEPQCSKAGVARCVTCKAWYCSAQCQAAHWPRHWRECLPLPDLEWLVQDDKTPKTVFVKKDSYSQESQAPPPWDTSLQAYNIGSAKLQDIATIPTKKHTETEAVQTKTIDICSTDSFLQGEASSSPVKTQPESSAAKDSAQLALPVSLSPSASDKKGEPFETLRSAPKEVAQVADPAIINTAVETSSAPSAVVKATSQTSGGPSILYTEAQFSSNLPAQILTKKVYEIVSPLDVIRSPCDFIVRLADSVRYETKTAKSFIIGKSEFQF